jgi:16S rRNA (cytosine967-C5)-methyltransferase
MVSRWLKRFGREGAEALMARNNARPTYSLRANAGPLGAAAGAPAGALLEALRGVEGVEAEASPLLPDEFVRVRAGLQAVLQEGLLARGACAVQVGGAPAPRG